MYQNNETLTLVNNQVHQTTDYFLFKPIDGNRAQNKLHLRRLRTSMQANYLFTVIIVNEKYEIIDGQHRFEVIKELKLPLNYIVCNGYGLNEVHILNQTSKIWSFDDYLIGYCDLGITEYLKYREFKNKYGFAHTECLMFLTNTDINSRRAIKPKFIAGNFKINDYDKACETVETIQLIASFYPNYRRRNFILSILHLLKNPKFQYEEFLQKLSFQPTALVDCISTKQYLALIEEIYNYRRKNKISLKY